MGESLSHESVELRRQRRLPLRRKFTVLPNRGLVGGAMILLLLAPVFVMVTEHGLSKGIYVRLAPRREPGPDENCIVGPIVVSVREHGTGSRLILDGTQVDREHLEQALKIKLAGRADWEVFIEGDDSLSFADAMSAVDAVYALHAKAVMLTPELKEQMAKACPSRQLLPTGVSTH
jgi:biopolymer transport protein ExbD